MIDVTEDISQRTNEADKRYTYELLEFKEFNTFFPIPEDEVIGLEFLLAEPGCSSGLVVPSLGVSSANIQKCFGTEDKQDHKTISNERKYSFHNLTRGERYQCKDNNGHVQGTDEGILQEMNNLPSICEDYLFDCKLAGEVSMLNSDSSSIPFINQSSEFTSQYGKECNDYEGNYCKDTEKMVDESMAICGDITTKVGRHCQSSASLFNEQIRSEVTSCGKEEIICDSIVTFSAMVNNDSLRLTENDRCYTQKRSRRRPLRYIDEYSKYHSTHTDNKRSGGLSRNTREKNAPYLDYLKDVNERKSVQYNEYITEPIQVPFGPSVLKECSRKKAFSSTDCDHEVYSNAIVKFSEGSPSTNKEFSFIPSQGDVLDCYDLDEVTKDKSGRKHNRYWSEYEIAKLIEGVATFGVGRWTEIKRGLFPPTSRRTCVDLKDKWRNLLKACRAHLHCTYEGRRVAHQQVSQSVLRKVRELAAVHPYPKRSPKSQEWHYS